MPRRAAGCSCSCITPSSGGTEKFKSVYVYGGHTHTWARWGGGDHVRTTSMALWGAGSVTLTRVGGDGIDLIQRCAGGKWGGWLDMIKADKHINWCAIGAVRERVWAPAAVGRKELKKLADQPLDGRAISLDAGPLGKAAQIEADIEPGSAAAITLALKGDDRTMSIRWDGRWLECDGIRVPMPLREWEKAVRYRILMTPGSVLLEADGMYLIERPLKAASLRLEASASGGTATAKRLEVYACNPGGK